MKIKSSVNFRLEKRINKETGQIIVENVPIIMDFTFDGKRMQYFTGHRIDKNKWDADDQKVIKNSVNRAGNTSTEINESLNELRNTVTDAYKEAKFFKKAPSVQYLRDDLRKRLKEEVAAEKSFFSVFDEFTENESKIRNWTPGTLTKFSTNKAHLEDFQKSKRFKIEFDSINEVFFIKYVDYLRDTLGHRNTTIAKNLKIFKWFMNWATKKGYNRNLAYKDYNPELKGVTRNNKVIFLTWDELMKLYDKKITKRYLTQVRDVFCFSCFTGLRYSDVFNLKRSNIKEGAIELTSIKTDESLVIDLNDYSSAILKKYEDTVFENNKCLPVISNQKMNDYLKELGQLLEFKTEETIVWYKGSKRFEKTYEKWELLSTHVGRKTFVTNAIFLNIPSEVIRKWTGHKDHKMLEKYYRIVDQQRRVEMQKFNRKVGDE